MVTDDDVEKWNDIFRLYREAFGEDLPLKHWNSSGVDLLQLMEAAIVRGRALSAEELGGGCPEGADGASGNKSVSIN